MKTKVLKFGGSSFPSLKSYNEIANYIKKRLHTDAQKIVLVVSAMSGTTGRIQEAGLTVNPEMSPEIADSLLATGEMVAACLMRTALEQLDIAATHLTGYQLGVVTDSLFTRAKPIDLDVSPLENALQLSQVVVISGGQAVDQQGRMTMLGRNSSDLTAVLVAAALSLEECEIFSDVPGVYSADPYVIPEARIISELPYDSIITMSRSGAKVLHHGAVTYAKDHQVRIVCKGTAKGNPVGTVIGRGSAPQAVIVNDKVEIIRLQREVDADQATDYFEKNGIVTIAIQQNDSVCLAISKENRAWKEVLAGFAAKYKVMHEMSLLTILSENDSVSYKLIPTCKSDLLSKIVHETFTFENRKSSEPSPRSLTKIKSEHSNLLVSGIQ